MARKLLRKAESKLAPKTTGKGVEEMTKRIAGFTESERVALEHGFHNPHGAMNAPVNRMGGAFRRVVDKLARDGLLTEKAPFRITRAGLVALVKIREQRDADSGCIAYMKQAEEAREALAGWPEGSAYQVRDYAGERDAKAITAELRKAGSHSFRVECDRPGVFWVQPAANGAILTTGRTAREAVERFANAGRSRVA
jgi:hypothetical protein